MDELFIEFIRERGLYDKIWQAFAVFLDVRSVGVQVRHQGFTSQGHVNDVTHCAKLCEPAHPGSGSVQPACQAATAMQLRLC